MPVTTLTTVGANAENVQFTVVDGVNTVTFDLPESPTPSTTASNEFVLRNIEVNVTSNGSKISELDTLIFQDATGNVEFFSDTDGWFSNTLGNILTTGPLFSGSNSDPTFRLGTYGSRATASRSPQRLCRRLGRCFLVASLPWDFSRFAVAIPELPLSARSPQFKSSSKRETKTRARSPRCEKVKGWQSRASVRSLKQPRCAPSASCASRAGLMR
jgi:hypothetical protein